MEEIPEGYYTAMAALCGAKIMNMFGGHMIIPAGAFSLIRLYRLGMAETGVAEKPIVSGTLIILVYSRRR